jgi:hypothetical protein
VSWGVGRTGALAEFCRGEAEACLTGKGALRTERGALRVCTNADIRVFPGEGLATIRWAGRSGSLSRFRLI